MEFQRIYNELCNQQVEKAEGSVKIRKGIFNDDDLIPVFEAGGVDLYFSIDQNGMYEMLSSVNNRLNEIKAKDNFNMMIDLFNIIQSEMTNYFGKSSQMSREHYYMLYGKNIDQDSKVCTMSELKGKGIAKCAEKASVANNLLLILNKMNVFPYKVNYLNALIDMTTEKGGHAFIEFSRINNKGNKIHIVYDVTNPEIILLNGDEFNYPAVYSLTEDDFNFFVKGGNFDNSHFVLNETYPVKEKRIYYGFKSEREDLNTNYRR